MIFTCGQASGRPQAIRPSSTFQQALRSILFVASMPAEIVSTIGDSNIQSLQNLLEQLRYAILIVGMLPMMLVYPFVQKFFIP